jgi:glucokinase
MADNNSDKKEIVVGVDIGGTNTVFGIVDFNNNILLEDSFQTIPENGAFDYFERLALVIKKACNRVGSKYVLSGIGVAAPGANYYSGIIESPANLKWGDVNFNEIMRKYFQVPVALMNDANAAALGEQEFGVAKGIKNFMVITLGTGLGTGIVVNGQLLYGENGLAGEIGHTIIKKGGRQCNCGRRGCLETYVSANGIKRTAFNFLGNSTGQSELRQMNYDNVTGKLICELAHRNDPIALKAFHYTGKVLGRALSNVVAIFDTKAIVLAGGLAESNALLFEPTTRYFESSLLNMYKGKVKILKSNLQDGKSAVLGATSFVRDMLCKEIKQVI